MRSNYKQLGGYIREVNIRDSNLEVELLLGVSIQKKFIPSIANTIGTDMSTYKIVKKNQFAYGPVTSRNGDKISVALLEKDEQAVVSQAYRTFEVINVNELLSEYLMLWFKRSEFDRYARFMSHGSTREVFGWDEMCETELPIPHIDKQKEIVKEYNVLVDRINLNNQFIQKLEETARAIYKQWFVDFEFPDENGKSYKSNDGEMVLNEELEKEIPKGWKSGALSEIIDITSGKTPFDKNKNQTAFFQYPIYGAGGIMGFSSRTLFDKKILSIGRVGTHGVVKRINFPCWPSDNTLIITSDYYEYVNQILNNLNYDEINRGGVQGLITKTDMNNSIILIPDEDILKIFEVKISAILSYSDFILKELEKLEDFNSLLLSKMATLEN